MHFYSVCAACRRRRGRGRGDRDGDEREPRGEDGKEKKEFEERVVQVSRVTKVVKGGKQMSFRAVVVVGDEKGKARARPSKSCRTAERRDGRGTCSSCCHPFLTPARNALGAVSAQRRCLHGVWVGWLAAAMHHLVTPCLLLAEAPCL